MREDVENPVFRLDMIIDDLTSRQLFDILRDQTQTNDWFPKCIQSKIIKSLKDGTEVFSTIFKAQAPLHNKEFIHKRDIQCDDEQALYMLNYSSLGLENIQGKHSKKISTAYYNICGIILRRINEEKGTKMFYVMQIDLRDQVPEYLIKKSIPNFMIEYMEKLVERARKVRD